MKMIFFADLVEYETPLPFDPLSPAMRERLIIVGALLFILAALIIAAVLSRGHRRRAARRRERHRRRQSFAKNAAKGVADLRQYVKDRQRRRRRHRPRNPTLAETGGLPPVRGANDQSRGTQPR